MTKISVITATYNAVEHLPVLIKSLREQTDKNFEWIIADGKSKDATLDLISDIDDLRVVVTSETDFGIYDALNRGVLKAKGEFYLVVGADDYLYPDAIENFRKEMSTEVDVIAASISFGGVIRKPGNGKSWLKGQFAYVAGHSTATLFRKSLHDKFGLYSRDFPIAADQLFIKKICQNGARLKIANFTSGYFRLDGVSGTDHVGTLTEFFRVQLLTEKNTYIQVVLFMLRLFKNINKL